MIPDPKTCPKVIKRPDEPKSPISPYLAHQKLKRTKTQRRAESKKRNYEKRLETRSNMTLYNSNISQHKNRFDQIESPSSSHPEDDSSEGAVRYQ